MKLESIEYSLPDDSYIITIRLYREDLHGASQVKPKDNDLAKFAVASMERSIANIVNYMDAK